MTTQSKINRKDVNSPSIKLTSQATFHLTEIIKNDFTLSGKYFRILISGKGCDGFTYSTGFTDYEENDFLLPIDNEKSIQIIVDPFTAFYLQNATVDYINNPETDSFGFHVVNHLQEEFAGKFWKKEPEKVPPTRSLSN